MEKKNHVCGVKKDFRVFSSYALNLYCNRALSSPIPFSISLQSVLWYYLASRIKTCRNVLIYDYETIYDRWNISKG